MKAKTHKVAELLTQAMGPVFQAHPDYQIILEAVGIAIARVAQSTPMIGTETKALNNICAYGEKALEEFLQIEETKKEKLEQGVAGFAKPDDIIKFPDSKAQESQEEQNEKST